MKKFNSLSKEYGGAAALLGAAFLYGWFGILIRFAGSSGIPAFFQIVLRTGLGVIILGIFVVLQKRRIRIPDTKSLYLYFFRSLFGLVSFTLSYFSFLKLTIATAYLFFYGGFIVGGFLIGWLVFRETQTKSKIVSLILAIIGVIAVYFTQFELSSSAIYCLMVFVAGLLSIVWSSFPRILPDKYSQSESNFYDTAIALVIATIASIAMKESVVLPTNIEILWPQIAFVMQMVLNGQLMIYGFKHVEAQIGSLIMLLEIVFASIFGYFVFTEIPSVYSLIGSIIIILASSLPFLADKMKRTV